MDKSLIEKYRNNPKTSFLIEQYEKLEKEEGEVRDMAKNDLHMDELIEDEVRNISLQKEALESEIKDIIRSEEKEEEFPNEVVLEVRAGVG